MRRTYAIVDKKITESAAEDAPIWVYITPDDNEKRFLVETCKLDEHTLGCALDPDETPRLEFEPDHCAIILNRPRNYCHEDQFMFKVASTGVFLFKERLIVVLADDVPIFDSNKPLARVGSLTDVMLKIFYRSIFHFQGHLKGINMIADELEEKIATSTENRYLLNLFALEKSLVFLTTAIHANSTLLEKLRHNAAKLGFGADSLDILDDLCIENGECGKQAEIHSSIIAGLMDARASIVNNNLNVMMKNLNAIVIAVAVPSLLAGIGGMSEFSMMTGASNWVVAYPIFLVAMLAIGVGTFYLIKRVEPYWR